MSLRTSIHRTVARAGKAAATTSASPACTFHAVRRQFSASPYRKETEAPPSNSAGKVRYDYKDALRIESSLLTEDEVVIKWVASHERPYIERTNGMLIMNPEIQPMNTARWVQRS